MKLIKNTVILYFFFILQNEEDYYTGNEETNFPIRWTAPEAIEKLKFRYLLKPQKFKILE